jgi:hypothetical protein
LGFSKVILMPGGLIIKKSLRRILQKMADDRRSREAQRERLAQRLRENQERSESSGGGFLKELPELKNKIWKCEAGSHTIDIIPYLAGKNDPFVKEGEDQYVYEFYQHKNVGATGKSSIMCLEATYGRPCPICEDRARRIREGEDEKLLKALRPGRHPKSIYNVLCWDKGEDKKGVQLFIVSNYFFGMHILALANKPVRGGQENIDPLVLFMDPDEGKSITFTKEVTKGKDGMDNQRFFAHAFADRPKGYEITQEDLDEAFCLDEIIKIPTYDEVADFYYGSGGRGGSEDRGGRSERGRGEEERGGRGRGEDEGGRSERGGRGRGEEDSRGGSERGGRERGGEDSSRSSGRERGSRSGGNKCPAGHEFGTDANEYPDDCGENCKEWEDCVKEKKSKRSGGERDVPASVGEDNPGSERPRARRERSESSASEETGRGSRSSRPESSGKAAAEESGTRRRRQ